MEHCWRSKDELINDVLLWTPPHGHTSVGRPVKTYISSVMMYGHRMQPRRSDEVMIIGMNGERKGIPCGQRDLIMMIKRVNVPLEIR